MTLRMVAAALAALALSGTSMRAQAPRPQAEGPVIVLETTKGTIEVQTYPVDAPKTVARILELVKKNFYNGLRFHRAETNVVQVGDPVSRDMSREAWWGRQGSGNPIGAAEITKRRRHLAGAVSMAHAGDPKLADSQFFFVKRASPEYDGKYTVFGRVVSGMDVLQKLQKRDLLKRASVKP